MHVLTSRFKQNLYTRFGSNGGRAPEYLQLQGGGGLSITDELASLRRAAVTNPLHLVVSGGSSDLLRNDQVV
jgi:hypothetical protein